MNKIDKDYQALLQDIMDNGVSKNDRTGTGTISVFGRQIRHKMSDGFPVITTKKMYFKGIVTELLWFLRGDTNIKYLVDNDCHIWDGDAYKQFLNETIRIEPADAKERAIKHLLSNKESKEEFINKIKTDNEFAKKWGELGPIYGKQWRSWRDAKYTIQNYDGPGIFNGKKEYTDLQITNIDQIANLISELKTNPESRRLMVNSWNVGELDQMTLPPCHYGFQVYTRELSGEERIQFYYKRDCGNGKLMPDKILKEELKSEQTVKMLDKHNIPTRAISLMWNQRSVDTGLGWPYNVTSYGLLLTILGKMVNMIPEELIGNLGDTHIYSDHIDGLKEQLTREPYQLPTLKINSGNENWHLLELDEVLNTLDPSFTFKLENYQSHPTIKLPLSN